MNHSQVMFKTILFFFCFLISHNFCEGKSIEQEGSQPNVEADLVVLPEIECPAAQYAIGIEALVFKTDIVNTTNFEITGITGLKSEQGGIKPIVETQLSYEGKDFCRMEDLVNFLENDPKIEILGFARDLCENNKLAKMFDDHTASVTRKLTPNILEDLQTNYEDGVCLENILCIKPEVLTGSRVDLTIFLEKAKLQVDPLSNGESVLLPINRFTLARVPVPDRFFTLLPGLIFEGKNEPTFGGSVEQYNAIQHDATHPQNIVLILKPFIFKK